MNIKITIVIEGYFQSYNTPNWKHARKVIDAVLVLNPNKNTVIDILVTD